MVRLCGHLSGIKIHDYTTRNDVCAYIRMCIYMCVCVCVCVYIYVCVCVCVCVCIYMNVFFLF